MYNCKYQWAVKMLFFLISFSLTIWKEKNQINPILFEKKPINRTKIRPLISKKQPKPNKCDAMHFQRMKKPLTWFPLIVIYLFLIFSFLNSTPILDLHALVQHPRTKEKKKQTRNTSSAHYVLFPSSVLRGWNEIRV